MNSNLGMTMVKKEQRQDYFSHQSVQVYSRVIGMKCFPQQLLPVSNIELKKDHAAHSRLLFNMSQFDLYNKSVINLIKFQRTRPAEATQPK